MEEEKEKLLIDDSWTYGCDRCVVCDNYYKHTRLWWGEQSGLYLLKEKIAHHECSKLVDNIKKKRQELIDLEYKLFEKQFMINS